MSATPLLPFHGNDLTGSTDARARKALSPGGIETVPFLREPTSAQLARFSQCRAIASQWLRSLLGCVCHYKLCSVFDSSSQAGSISRAINIGHALFERNVMPLVVGVLQLRHYTASGNLFARVAAFPVALIDIRS